MRRALQLACRGEGYVSPNPMVGAVIVCDGRIIGEGYHRRYGQAHAEVNAVESVADKSLLRRSTIYVTLEPCAHYGKTPPCAELLVRCGFRRVVIGTADPFAKVSGRGIAILREAGIEVTVGVLERECREINRKFMTAHLMHRPFVMLKWACSADGYIDRLRRRDEQPQTFSTPLTRQLVHQLRARFDAIAVGAGTVLADSPSLTVRDYAGRAPRPVVFDRHGITPADAAVMRKGAICFCSAERPEVGRDVEVITDCNGLASQLSALYVRGITSLLVEGGAGLLDGFIKAGLWDEARIEIAPGALGPVGGPMVEMPAGEVSVRQIDGNSIVTVINPQR